MILNEAEQLTLINVLKKQNDILYNDIDVMRAVIKSILNLKAVRIDNVDYFKVEDIARICNENFKLLSNEMQKESDRNGKNDKRKN